MKLKVVERLVVPSLRPQESDLITQTVFKDILEKVAIDQEEMEKIGMKTEGQNLKWNSDTEDLEVAWTKAEINLLKDRVSELNKQKKITPQLTDLALKITGYAQCPDERPDKKEE